MNKKLIEVTKSNEDAAGIIIIVILAVGISLSIVGAQMWYSTIQKRDDRLAALQQEKLELEIEKLRSELAKPVPSELPAIEGAGNEGYPSFEATCAKSRAGASTPLVMPLRYHAR